MKRLAIVFALALAGCTADTGENIGDDESALTPLPGEVDDAVTRTPWTSLGAGVAYKAIGTGNDVLLVYGGYTSTDEYVRRLANQYWRVKGESLGFGHVYAVRGPDTEMYDHLEIENTEVAKHLGANGIAKNAQSLVILAHSSGTYVADELLRMLDKKYGGVPADTMGKLVYFNLDGGVVTNPSVFEKVGKGYFVYSCDPGLGRCSFNAADMQSEAAKYPSLGGAIKLDATSSGCGLSNPGGRWCMHDTLITTRPHNANAFDLRRDYTDFTGSGRELVTSYFDEIR